MATSLSKLNRFSKFFDCGKEEKSVNKTHISHQTQSMLPHYLWKVKVQICGKLQTSCLMKRNMSCHMVRQTMLLSSLQQLLEMSHFLPVQHALRCLRHKSIASSITLWSMLCQMSSQHFFSSSVLCSCDWCTRCWMSPHIS